MVFQSQEEKRQVTIREVGPREGVQSYPSAIKTEDKLTLISLLADAGFAEIEATALVRKDKVPAMSDSDEIIAGLPSNRSVKFSALYLNDKGFERALSFAQLHTQGWLSISASETFLIRNNNQTFAGMMEAIPRTLNLYKNHKKDLSGVMVSNAFGCQFEGDKEAHDVIHIINGVLDLCDRAALVPEYVMFADTTGMATPPKIFQLVSAFKKLFPSIKVGLHLHNTRGMGIANAYVGLLEGVDFFDASIAGVGGCPFVPNATGNIATEELVLLCESMGISTGIDSEKLKEAVRYASKIFTGQTSSRISKILSNE